MPLHRRAAREDARGHRRSAAGCPPRTRRRSRCRRSCGTAASAARWPRSACRRRRCTRSAGRPPPRPRAGRRPASRASSRSPTMGPCCTSRSRAATSASVSEHLVVRKDGQELTRVPMHAIRQVVRVRQRAGFDAGAGDAGRQRHPGGIPDGLRPVHRHPVAGAAEERGLREAAVPPLRRPGRVPGAGEGGGAGQADQPADAADAEPARRRRPRQRRAGRSRPGGIAPAAGRGRRRWRRCWGWRGRGRRCTSASSAGSCRSQPPGRGFDFTTRNRRPPRDPVNALLSFAYALLTKDCFAAVCTVGFDPYKGFFHSNRHGKPSLALDLMEEFRPVIADWVVLTLINNEMLTPDDFLMWREACQLTEAGRQEVLRGVRAAEGDGGDAPGLRLQDVLFADAGGAGADAGGVRARRRAGLHGLHGALGAAADHCANSLRGWHNGPWP